MILLVTSRDTGRWVLPKGWTERKVSDPDQAAREAFEEAGVVGTVSTDPIGDYAYLKRLPNGRSVPCRVEVYPLTVQALLDDWPERQQRERRWFRPADAAALVAEAGLGQLMRALEPPRAA